MPAADHRFVTMPPVKWSKVNKVAGATTLAGCMVIAALLRSGGSINL